jgi:predicted transcriptional regulator
MKIKKIIIKTREDFNAETLDYARSLDRGEKRKPLKGEYFESLEAVRTFLTERRLEIWRTIRDKKPKSLTELAKLVHRDYKDVHQDVSILIEVGLVDLKKPKNLKTRALIPISMADQIEFKVA